jgi:hypothetical protein
MPLRIAGTFAPAARAFDKAMATICLRWPLADLDVSTVRGLLVKTSWNAFSTLGLVAIFFSGKKFAAVIPSDRWAAITQPGLLALHLHVGLATGTIHGIEIFATAALERTLSAALFKTSTLFTFYGGLIYKAGLNLFRCARSVA